ncbi:hypothetical protein JMN32_02230 [Fulvivirga sp. 29W222]|uniref:Bacterial surface antigen (D15) domain-containing protein n=1 Tax=Fulvivirga marina TaxID=2494733 RepID=A0A937FV54_9BACT|nr:hypothetical protein [Fulvivirga marina]MBL6445107.1 hypothetical protein [Fulvivirga marina]
MGFSFMVEFFKLRQLIVFALMFVVCPPLMAQKKGKQQPIDSVHVKGRSILILGDSSIYVEQDTVLILPDTVAIKLKQDETKKSEEFYKKVKERLYKTRFTKELYRLLFNDVKKVEVKEEEPKAIITNGNYKKYKGQVINNIRIKKLEVFGTRITDTTKNYNSWAINLANDMHVYTRSRIIKSNIFFKEGDVVDPDALTDSERILRSLPYIKDARIYVISRKGVPGVEILVIVKDIWSISGEVSIDNVDRSDFAVIDKNFLGLGHEFRNEFLYNTEYVPKVGYNGIYSVNNIYKTFITGEVNYARSEPLDRVGVRFYRNFITPEIKYAGGIEINKSNMLQSRIFPDTTVEFYTKFNQQDIWLGRSWLIDETDDGGRTNLQLGTRFNRIRYLDRPIIKNDTNQQFFDRNLYLFSVGISQRSYEKSALILGYGRTEDIPSGYLLEFTVGKEVNEYYNRAYLGWRFSVGRYFGRLGYIRPSAYLGGFVRKSRVDQGVFSLQGDYFSPLFRVRKFNFRQFLRLRYTTGINRYDNEFININNKNGIRGLNYTFLRGTRKLSFSSETVAFTPFYIIGFRFAFFGFFDLAIVNANNSKLLKNKLYQGYGFGVRLRNENLAINTIQVRLVWYPVTPPGTSGIGFDLAGQTPLRLSDFRVEEPSVIGFN